MAEFTKDIATLTKQASASPTLQTNTGSLATDVVSAVGFGLDLYRQNKAKTELASMKQAQSAKETMVSRGMLEYRNTLASLSDQGASRTRINKESNAILAKYKGHEIDIIAGLKKVEGTTAESTKDDATAAANAQLKAEDTRRQSELLATENATILGYAVDASVMSDEEIHKINVKAKIQQTKDQVRIAEKLEARNDLTDTVEKQRFDNDAFASESGLSLGRTISANLGTTIKKVGGSITAETAPLIIDSLNQQKVGITASVYEMVNNAKQLGINVTPATVKTLIQDQERAVDNVIELFSKTESLKALQNNMNIVNEGKLVTMLNSGNADEAYAAQMLLNSKFLGAPQELKNFNVFTKFVGKALVGDISPEDASFKQTMESLPSILTPIDGVNTPETQASTQKILDTMFNSGPTKTKEVLRQGGYDAVTKALSTQGIGVIAPEHAIQTADDIYREGSKILAGSISRAMKENSSPNTTSNEYRGLGADQNVMDVYEMDVEAGLFVKTNAYAARNKDIEKVNTLMKNTLSSFDALGMDDNYKNAFINDVMLSLGLASKDN